MASSIEFPPTKVRATLDRISTILKERKQTIAVTESACGGLISAYLVSVPGASMYYQGGTLTYSLKSRLKLSGWSQNDINSYTGPSEDVALRLARNLKMELGSTYALSETGWAGPTGGETEDQAIGTVFYGIASPHNEMSIKVYTGLTDRAKNMEEFAIQALQFFLAFLEQC